MGTKAKAAAREPGSPWATSGTAALALVAAGAVGDVAHLPPVAAAAITVPGALMTLFVSARHAHHAPSAILYRLACWAGAGTWTTWVLTSPGNWHNLTGLVAISAGAATAAIAAPFARTDHTETTDQPGTGVALYKGGTCGREWAERIRRVCRLTVEVTGIVDWATRTGYDVHALLPIGGATVDDLARQAKALATDARLPRGCAIRVTEGDLQGEVIIAVPTVNRLRQEIPFEPDLRPRTINEPIPIGEYQDGRTVGVPLRQLSVLAVGKRGSGKTTLLDLFNYGIGMCLDAIVWHIDLNGGGMSWSWMQPWIRGETDRPAIDWAATTPEEALAMVKLAYAIGHDRKGSYGHLKDEQNVRLLPLSRELPAIEIVVDEGKTVLASTATGTIAEIRDTLILIQDELRDAGVGVVASGLRATATYIAPDFKTQIGVKIGMRTQSDAELAYLFDWGQKLKCEDLPSHCGYVQYEEAAPEMFKTPHILPANIAEGAVVIANQRPDVDAAARRIGGDIYATHYDLMRKTFSKARPSEPGERVVEPELAAVGAGVVTPFRRPSSASAGRPDQWPSPLDRFREPQPGPAPRPSEWPSPLDRFRAAPPAPAPQVTPVQDVPAVIRDGAGRLRRAGRPAPGSGTARALRCPRRNGSASTPHSASPSSSARWRSPPCRTSSAAAAPCSRDMTGPRSSGPPHASRPASCPSPTTSRRGPAPPDPPPVKGNPT